MNAVSNKKRCPSSMAFLISGRLAGTQISCGFKVQVQSSSCCFPRELVSFVRPRELVSFDPRHVARSPPIGKHI